VCIAHQNYLRRIKRLHSVVACAAPVSFLLAEKEVLLTKHSASVLLFLYDKDTEFFTHTQLSAGYNLDSMEVLDPAVGKYLSDFLQIYKLQNVNANIDTDARRFALFSWGMQTIKHDTVFSAVPYPHIVIAIHADNPKADAVKVKMFLEALPEPKKTLDEWFDQLGRREKNRTERVVIKGDIVAGNKIQESINVQGDGSIGKAGRDASTTVTTSSGDKRKEWLRPILIAAIGAVLATVIIYYLKTHGIIFKP